MSLICRLTLLLSLVSALTGTLFAVAAQDNLRHGSALRSVACYGSPVAGLLPERFLNRGDTVAIDSVLADTAGGVWFRIMVPGQTVWARQEGIVFAPQGVDTARDAGLGVERVERNRRLEALRHNPQWERRIKRAVREGRICLGMNAIQVEASWGVPDESVSLFVSGMGNSRCMLYRSANEPTVLVIMVDSTVGGWSIGEAGLAER